MDLNAIKIPYSSTKCVGNSRSNPISCFEFEFKYDAHNYSFYYIQPTTVTEK